MGNMSEDLIKIGEEQGREEGREQGRNEEKRGTVARMLNLGRTLEDIAQCVGLTLPEVRALAEQMRGA